MALPQHASAAPAILVLLNVLAAVYGAFTWRSRGRMLLFWAVAWTGIHLAPLVAVTYQSPRHIFLASAGLLVALATAATMPRSFRSTPGVIALLLCVLLLGGFTIQAVRALPAWEASSRYSRQLVELLRAGTYEEDAVVLVRSTPRVTVWFWQWALPFAADSPFVDLKARIVGPLDWECCASSAAERERLLADTVAGRVRQIHHIEFNSRTDQFEDVTAGP